MAKYLQIQIPVPCHEKWEEMEHSAGGGFCKSCQKTVIDFTGMTDSQLLEYFTKYPSHTCGRFHTGQLEQPIEIPVKRIPWLKYFFQISLPALLFSYKANAQRLTKKHLTPVAVIDQKRSPSMIPEATIPVSGRITTNDGSAVAFASVMIEGTNEGTVADSNGCYTLRLNGTAEKLEVSAAGYQTTRVFLTGSMLNDRLDISMERDNALPTVVVTCQSNTRMGSYTTGSAWAIIHQKNTAGHSAASAKAISLEVFPNPAKRSGRLTIRWKDPVSHPQQITIYNASGMKVREKTIPIGTATIQSDMNPGLAAAGYYIIQITDSKTRETQAVPLIIE